MPRRRFLVPFSCFLSLGAILAPARAGEPPASSSAVQISCDPMKARQVDDGGLATAVVIPEVGDDPTGFCFVQATDHTDPGAPENNGRKGVKVSLEGEIVDLDTGAPRGSFRDRGRTGRDGYYALDIGSDLAALSDEDNLGVIVQAGLAGGRQIAGARLGCFIGDSPPCGDSDTSLCFADGRFKVEVEWRSSSGSGPGGVVRLSDDEGIFFFQNTDLVIQLLNQCRFNDHFWVFAAATTSVEYDVTVTDTRTGASRDYFNPLGQPANAITDTSAFATCP